MIPTDREATLTRELRAAADKLDPHDPAAAASARLWANLCESARNTEQRCTVIPLRPRRAAPSDEPPPRNAA